MNTKKITVTIFTLVIGVILITGVMTPILSATLSDSDTDDDESAEQTYTNTGTPLREIPVSADYYGLYTTQTDNDLDIKGIRMVNINGELHWQTYRAQGPVGSDLTIEVLEDHIIDTYSVLIIGWDNLITYDTSKIMICGGQNIEYIDLSDFNELRIEKESSSVDDSGYVFKYDYLDNPYDGTISGAQMTDAITGPTAYIYDPVNDYVASIGNNSSAYYIDSIGYGYIGSEGGNVLFAVDGAVNGYLADTSPDGTIVASYPQEYQYGQILPSYEMNDYVKHVSSSAPITLKYLIEDPDAPYFTTEQQTVSCNMYIAPKTVTGIPEPPMVSNNGTNMARIDTQLQKGYYAEVNPSSIYYTAYGDDGTNTGNGIPLDIGSIEESCIIFVSDTVAITYDATAKTIRTNYIQNGEVQSYEFAVGNMADDDYIAIDVGDGAITLDGEWDGGNLPVEIADVPIQWAYAYSGFGKLTCVRTGSVSYQQQSDLSYGSISRVSNSDSIGFWSDGESVFSFTDGATATFGSMVGTTENDGYTSFTIGSSGVSLNVSGGSTSTVICNAYIVPKAFIASDSPDEEGISDTMKVLITTIPLVMTIGLVIGTVGFFRFKN